MKKGISTVTGGLDLFGNFLFDVMCNYYHLLKFKILNHLYLIIKRKKEMSEL